MTSESQFRTISLDDVNAADQRFRISTSDPSGALVDTIQHVGVLTPPILLAQGKTHIIVSGFKRLEACRQLDIRHVMAQIYSSDTPAERCIRAAVVENALSDNLNLLEQIRAVELLETLYPDPDRLCREANRLGLRVNLDMIEKLLTVSRMSPVVHKALITGHLALPVALQLRKGMDDPAVDLFAVMLDGIGLSLNRQREFVDWVVAIAAREEISILDVLKDRELNRIRNHPDTDHKLKARQIRAYLHQRRYPEISRVEERYQAFIKRLNLGKGVHLVPPPHFEGTTYAIKIDFKSYDELLHRYRQLEVPLKASSFPSLWETIGLE